MKQPTTVLRIPGVAFDVFAHEAIRQCRPVGQIILGASRAFKKLSPALREEFTIGEPMTIETAASLLGRTSPAKPNRKRGAK